MPHPQEPIGDESERLGFDGGNRPLLICHIIFRLDVGGLENGLVNLINHLPAANFRHAIVCLQYAGDFRTRIRRDDITIHELHKGEGKALGLYGKVWRLLRQLKPDIVHTRNLPTIDMLAPARLAGVRRLVHSEHGLDQLELHGRHHRYNRLRRLSRLFACHYIAVSTDLGSWLQARVGVPARRISVIINGVDTDRFQPGAPPTDLFPAGFLPKEPFVVGTVGRFEPVKDQLNLAHAFVRLLRLHPALRERARLVLVGDGACRDDIEALLTEHGVRELCWLPGFRDDVAPLYRGLDLFVLPSRREGISNTALEAMATGLPVLATRVGGNPEIISDQITGTLVPAQDPSALCDAMLTYLEDIDLSGRHGRAGRKAALHDFSLVAMVAQYQQVYLSL